MSLENAKSFLNKVLLNRLGYRICHNSMLYDWQKCPQQLPDNKSRLPADAESYLLTNNPILRELRERYSIFDDRITDSDWKNDHVGSKNLSLLYFRRDNAYVFQRRGQNNDISGYALATYYLKSIDTLALLEKLEEDDFFGVYTFHIDNKTISRDLLDSISEIYFLRKYLDIETYNILDIGAGYGRLAHRLLTAFPSVKNYLCTDAIAESTFISEYYLRFHKQDRGKVIPFDKIEDTMKSQNIDIALNIHSFSECRISAVEYWLSLLVEHRVKYLFIVPNGLAHGDKHFLSTTGEDIEKVIETHGYKLIIKEPKYSDQVVQQYAINPSYYYLYELQ